MYENNVPVSKEQAAFLAALKKRKITVLLMQVTLLISFFLLWEIAAINNCYGFHTI